MKIHIHSLIAASLLVSLAACSTPNQPVASCAATSCRGTATTSKADVLALFAQWNASLATGNPKAVADLYAPNSILLPTVSNKPRRTRAERIDYFEHFLLKKPRGKIDQANIRIFGKTAIDSGLYTFTFNDGSKVHARYTFVYHRQPDGKWLIVEHHSSVLPESTK